jgi:hypothetical protein
MTDESSYSVVLSQSDRFDVNVMADVMSSFLGIHRLDVITQIKHSWGFLYKTPEKDKAQFLQKKFKKAGIETFVLPASEIKEVPQPKVLKKAMPEPEGLIYPEKREAKLLPWYSVVLACAGEVEETKRVKETLPRNGKAKKWLMRTGLSVTTGVAISYERSKKKEVTKEEASSRHYLDLIAKDGFESLRIVGDSFDYSYLGSRMGHNALLNFKSFVLDVGNFLAHVIKNKGMRAIESGAVMKDLRYDSLDDFEKEKSWLVQLTRDMGR